MDFYTKSEIDEKFGVTISSPSWRDLYTKTEIDANVGTPETLVLPANMLDFYTKTEIDSISAGSLMPYMDGVTNYYDCKIGLTTATWENQVDGGNDATFVGMEIQTDGAAGVMGTNASYGKFVSEYTQNRTIYAVFRAPILGKVNLNRHVIGSCGGNINSFRTGAWFSISIDGYGGYDHIATDQWGIGAGSQINCADYHVAAVTRSGNTNTLYVDGVLIGTLANAVAYSNNWGIGLIIDDFDHMGVSPSSLQQIKMIAVGNTAHTADQVARNSAWLRSYYELD